MNGRCLAVSLLALESKGSDSDLLSWGRRLDCCDSRTDVRTRRIEMSTTLQGLKTQLLPSMGIEGCLVHLTGP